MHSQPTPELRILGCMMRYNSTLITGLSSLQPENFRSDGDRAIFETILEVHQSGLPVDLVNVARRLGVHGVMEKVGGYVRLATTWESACLESDFEQLIEKLRQGG